MKAAITSGTPPPGRYIVQQLRPLSSTIVISSTFLIASVQ